MIRFKVRNNLPKECHYFKIFENHVKWTLSWKLQIWKWIRPCLSPSPGQIDCFWHPFQCKILLNHFQHIHSTHFAPLYISLCCWNIHLSLAKMYKQQCPLRGKKKKKRESDDKFAALSMHHKCQKCFFEKRQLSVGYQKLLIIPSFSLFFYFMGISRRKDCQKNEFWWKIQWWIHMQLLNKNDHSLSVLLEYIKYSIMLYF